MSTTKASDFTKKMMADALREKMTVKPLNKITIQEIVGECGLNRQTFYYHFKDIYDLLHWLYEYDAEQILKSRITTDTWRDNLLKVLQYVEENKQMCLCALRSVQHDYLRRFLYADVEPVVMDLVEEVSQDLEISDKYKSFLTHFYTVSIAALLIDWLDGVKNDLDYSAEALVDLIAITIDGNLRLALERYQQSRAKPE